MAVNHELLRLARYKLATEVTVVAAKNAFVDPSMAAGAGAAGGVDPMAGPMPPMPAMGAGGDPAAAGSDPSMAGGAPPAAPMSDPGAGGAPAGVTADEVRSIVEQALAAQGAGGGMAAGVAGAAGKMKPKIDVNTEIYQIKKLLVSMAQEMGLPIEPKMLLGDPAMDPAIPQSEAAKDPFSSAATEAGAGLGSGSAIQPIDPMQGASPALAAAGGQGKVASSASVLHSEHAVLVNGEAVVDHESLDKSASAAGALGTWLRRSLERNSRNPAA